MIQNEKNRNVKEKPLLLYSPLDWGLGHLTRSIPIIRAFQEKGWQIAVACNSTQKTILQSEIYDVTFYDLPGYNIRYSLGGWLTRTRIIAQFGKILMKIKVERLWLTRFIDKYPVELVISDNRYGFYDPRVHCILITHQLAPRSGLGTVVDRWFQGLIYSMVNRFSECWIPDQETSPNLAGALSHPTRMPSVPAKYIGPLSRLTALQNGKVNKYQLLIILSGPEPQRRILETKLMKELKAIPHMRCALARGTSHPQSETASENTDVFDLIDSFQLRDLTSTSEYVLCRSGYSSLMDMMKLKKKMILIPTPGQTEQEYLAEYFMTNRYALSYSQKNFSIRKALRDAAEFDFKLCDCNMEEYINYVTASVHA